MPDAEEAGPPTETFAQALERVVEGGLLRLLVGKPIQQAIGRLISGAADVPIAYLERWSQGVRSDTTARKQISATIASAARTIAANDSELVDRGLERWTRQLQSKQRTREDIAVRALDVLAEVELAANAAAPSEDFMRVFEDICEKVSSDDLTDLMARILAGEIRKPGSVSRRTLQVVAVLDHEIVGALNELKPYLLDPGWVHIPPSRLKEWRHRFALLASVSIFNEVGPRRLYFDEDCRCGIAIGNQAIGITSKPPTAVWFVDGANLTPIGGELVSVLPLSNDSKLREVALGIKELEFVDKVEIGVLSSMNGEPHEFNSQEII